MREFEEGDRVTPKTRIYDFGQPQLYAVDPGQVGTVCRFVWKQAQLLAHIDFGAAYCVVNVSVLDHAPQL